MSGRRAPEPYLGPETGDALDFRELAELELLALKRAASRVTQPFPLPPCAGPLAAGELKAV